MSTQMALRRERGRLSLPRRLEARLAVGCARLLARMTPARVRLVLSLVRRGARPATHQQALAAREATVSVSVLCAAECCLPRSIATALLCRAHGVWPTWCVGVRTSPFASHAWVEVDGTPVGEPFPAGYHQVLMRVGPGCG